MTLQDLLKNTGIDLKRTKLVRHNLSDAVVARSYENDCLEIYQSIQTLSRFKNCDTVITFLGTEGTNGVFWGIYKIAGIKPDGLSELSELHKKLVLGSDTNSEELVIYEMSRTNILEDLIGRLVIDWGKGTINWCHNGITEKEILEIRPIHTATSFEGYDKVLLSYKELKKIIDNKSSFKEWENKLSAVAGIYLITDTKTGKQYVGSASSENGGIWGRWSEYAKTKHGNNKRLKELIDENPDYCDNFQYSILEVLPIKKERHEVLEYEQLYKRKLKSIEFGLNDN